VVIGLFADHIPNIPIILTADPIDVLAALAAQDPCHCCERTSIDFFTLVLSVLRPAHHGPPDLAKLLAGATLPTCRS
jgi:hypothetical protein